MTNALPYYRSKTRPHLAKERIHKCLEKFGVDQVNLYESFKDNEIRVSFIYKDIPVSIPVNYRKLGELYAGQKWDYIYEKDQKSAKNSAYAAIEDYLKAMLTMHELGIMDITEIFMPNLVGKDGVRLAEHIQNHLPEFLEGKLLLKE